MASAFRRTWDAGACLALLCAGCRTLDSSMESCARVKRTPFVRIRLANVKGVQSRDVKDWLFCQSELARTQSRHVQQLLGRKLTCTQRVLVFSISS